MSFAYSDLNAVLTHEQEEKLDNVLIDLSLVCSIFDEEIGPIIIYNDSLLSKEVLDNLNIKVFSFLMQGNDFGPNNFAKMRGIVQIPHSEYYTSAIDVLVRKEGLDHFYDTYVPLVVFLIFPKKHLGTYAKIAISLEDFISKKFGDGLSQIPALKTLEDFIKQLYTKIKESRLV